MSFGQPFLPYAVALHNPQLLLTTTGVQIVSSSSAAVGANLLNVPSKSASGSTGSQPISSASTAGQSSLGAPSVRAGSNSCANLLASSTESGEMSADSLRLLASAGAGHHGMVGPPPPGLIASAGSQAATSAGPPMPPIFAGMPSLDPYRLPPPPFGLYSGGISPAGGPLDLKMPDGLPPGAFAHPAPAGMPPFYYDPAFGSAYPYAPDRYGNPLDLNGARRKNATRETTAALKAWLYEHRKNPYPTKGEKIMLAIITKMTLTQVSTWFANARRRLKKENKMTWSPRNRPGEEDDGVDGNSNTQENSGGLRPGSSLSSLGDDGQDGADDDLDDLGTDPAEAGSSLNVEGAKHSVHGLIKPGETDDKSEASGSTKRLANSEEPAESPKKLKIWSIAETVATPDPSPAEKAKPPGELAQQQQQQHHHQGPYHFTFPPWPHMAAAAAFAGRSPLMQPANSAASSIAPNFPFGAVAQGPFGMPGSIASLPHPHQRPELFARNFFAPAPPPVSMMNAAAATGLPGFLNGFSFGCPAPAFPFGFNLPGASSAALGAMSTQMQPPQNGASETGGNSNEQQNESKCSASGSPVSSNGGRKSSISSQEPKTSTP